MLRISTAVNSAPMASVLGIAGSVTIIMASVSALLETDMKKIVALSTLRQLGVIILSLRLGLKAIAFFHLVVHAFFKALLFICTGSLIHNANDYQDLRRTGGGLPALPVMKATILITKLSLCGVPFFSAFFSKELVLESLRIGNWGIRGAQLFIWVGVGLTSAYSSRFVWHILKTPRRRALS